MVFFNKLFLIDDSNFWKLDKIDKIVIALIFIIGCACACFATESETLTPSFASSLNMTTSRDYFISGSQTIGYYPIEKNYRYTITNNSTANLICGFSSEVPDVNVNYYDSFQLNKGDTFVFYSNNVSYLFFDSQHNSRLSVVREPSNAMQDTVDLVSTNAGMNLWESFTSAIPFILPLVLVCFGMYIISSFVNKHSKGV